MMSEQAFEYRLQKILESNGYLVFNVRMPMFGGQHFDVVALKNGRAFPIEIKGLRTVKRGNKTYKYPARYPDEQREKQMKLAESCGTDFFLIQQSKERGKMIVVGYDAKSKRFTSNRNISAFKEEFKEWIEE